MYLAPQNIPSAIILTLGHQVVLYRVASYCIVYFANCCFNSCAEQQFHYCLNDCYIPANDCLSCQCTLQKWYPVTFGISDTTIFYTNDKRDDEEDDAEEDIDYDEYFDVSHYFFLFFLFPFFFFFFCRLYFLVSFFLLSLSLFFPIVSSFFGFSSFLLSFCFCSFLRFGFSVLSFVLSLFSSLFVWLLPWLWKH